MLCTDFMHCKKMILHQKGKIDRVFKSNKNKINRSCFLRTKIQLIESEKSKKIRKSVYDAILKIIKKDGKFTLLLKHSVFDKNGITNSTVCINLNKRKRDRHR